VSGVPTTADYVLMLRRAPLRVTGPRLAVLDAVHTHPHSDTDSLIGEVRAALPSVSHQAVYDVLRALTATRLVRRIQPTGFLAVYDVLRALTTAGLVRRIQPSGSVARYEARVGDNHHHVVCRSCGTIADVDCAVGPAPCLTASDDRGFVIDEAEVTYWGWCRNCAAVPATT
jgi:Fe2+ or Zn2+ uptake regulation protein